VLEEAKRLEDEGHRILKLNIGNPAPFGFEAPDEILVDMIAQLPLAQGYSDSKGIIGARRAVTQYYRLKGVEGVSTEDVYLGNGVSELIVMVMQALLDNGDEILIPAPTTRCGPPRLRWPAARRCTTAATRSDWYPDLADIRAKITDRTGHRGDQPQQPHRRGVPDRDVLEGIVQIAIEHGLVLLADEIYDKILYDDAQHTALAPAGPRRSASPSTGCRRPIGWPVSAPAG
jgi:alanine-synthesizing transaminase